MEDIISKTNIDSLEATHSAVSVDLDKDGYVDLLVARQTGVFLYKNNKDGIFTKSLLLKKQKDSTPLAISISDYDKDGNPDIYVSQFIDDTLDKYFQFHNKKHSKKNVMLKGKNDGTFEPIDESLTGAINKHNTSYVYLSNIVL